ncbi:hypothetical protein DES53_102637 [Roseimicrobium gellanilyticum]|uniref:Uncharacterized protein n=1 Tax=Roseimicrobium gellanilyticum TaxID=748857 RepID=A0A366HRF0_9BACT|nr:hypothetical protein [Roseimicrobium gellanilyticum]RBP46250.1 hypothetical protein DES53_102637 [Roseimicrobium gellanilyticum]
MKRRPFLERFASRKLLRNVVLGVAWYPNERTWAEVKAFAQDPDRFEDSHVEWEAMASESVASFGKQGIQFVKVPMEPDVFRQWLKDHGEENNASSRAAYASEKAKEHT